MKKSILPILDRILGLLVVGLIFLIPVFFLSSTVSVLEYPKLVALVVGVLLMLFVAGVKTLVDGEVRVLRSAIDLPFLLFTVVFIFSTWFSTNRVNSVIGTFGVWHWSLISFFALIGFYYGAAYIISSQKLVEKARTVLLVSAGIVALGAILAYVSQFRSLGSLPGLSVLTTLNFDFVGGPLTLIVFLGALMPMVSVGLTRNYKEKNIPAVWLYTLLTVLFALAVVFWVSAYIPGLNGGVSTPKALSVKESWIVSSSSLRDFPIFGSGPGTFVNNFTRYRSAGLNANDNWELSFTKGYNEYFNVVATLGIAGIVALILLIWRVIKLSFHHPGYGKSRGGVVQTGLPVLIVFVGWLFTSANIVTSFLLFVLFALWMAEEEIEKTGLAETVVLGITAREENRTKKEASRTGLLSWGGVAVSVLVSVVGVYAVSRDLRSNTSFTDSLRLTEANASGVKIYDAQRKSITLNPYRDGYQRAFAQTNLALANAIAGQKAEEITEQERQEITTLIQQSIRGGRLITENLDPLNVVNWQVRGEIYEELIGVAEGSEEWALNAYRNAISLDARNPKHYIKLGGIYYNSEQYVLAEQAFTTAVQLKPDLANAHFNLGAALRENGKLDLAQQEFDLAERILGEEKSESDVESIRREREKLEELLSKVTPAIGP